MLKHFHNTIGLHGEELKQAVIRCTKQEDKVLMIYLNTRRKFTASDIHDLLLKTGMTHPITSTRRAVSNLFASKDLVKLLEQKKGRYNMNECFYQINAEKYPTTTSIQPDLFKQTA